MNSYSFINALSDYLKEHREDIQAYNLLGSVYRESGQPLKAAKIHGNLLARPDLKKKPKADVLTELAKDFYQHGDFQRSQKFLKEALDIDSKNPDALYTLYKTCKRLGQMDEAVRAAEKITDLDSKVLSDTYTEFGSRLLSKGDFSKAKNSSKRLWPNGPPT